MTIRHPIVLGLLLLLVGGFFGALDGLLSQGFTPSFSWSRPVNFAIKTYPTQNGIPDGFSFDSWNGCSHLWTPEWPFSRQEDFFGQAHRAAVSRCDI